MEKVRTPGKKAATRARLMEVRTKRIAEREVRERANITDLTEYFVQVERHDEVDKWLRDQVDKAKTEAKDRRLRHRVAAGRALQAMLDRGEKISAVAEQAETSVAKARTYLAAAAEAAEPKAKTAQTEAAEPKADTADTGTATRA